MSRILIKIGGELAGTPEVLRALAGEIQSLIRPERGRIRNGVGKDSSCLLVHGGGAEVTDLMRKMGYEPTFHDGIRITSPVEMDFVDMMLSGCINKRVVRTFQSQGINAVGLSGSDGRLFTGVSIDGECRTAEIDRVESGLLNLLLHEGYSPVVSSTSMGEPGGLGLNINADSVAFALAEALEVNSLVFLSNIPGVLKQGKPISSLSAREAERAIGEGIVTGGMIPKVRASVGALDSGVERILIGEFKVGGDLESLLSGRVGTQIYQNENKRRKANE